jgi:hypothetical protein
MKIPSSKIPQADMLDDVLSVANAVDQGARTFQDIAKHIQKVERQGRYYRLAAELLGLIRNDKNNSELTDLGKVFVSSNALTKNEIARNAVLNAHVFQRMLPFFELHPDGVSRNSIEDFIEEVTQPTTQSMIHRRASTLLSWLEKIGVLENNEDIYKIRSSQTSSTPIMQFPDDEPLAPKSSDLNEYKTVQERTERAGETIQVLIDQAVYDRANAIHRGLINIVADRLRDAGSLPRFNRFVDLATTTENQAYLFEMKSVNKNNSRSQIRSGLSQLYEYRYLQNLPDAKLILVISDPLDKKDTWMQEYLEDDRQIHLVWDGNNQLFASKKTKQELSFLWR